ncbi:MAG: glycosyltransferase [Phycisphaerae bacterium]|nr:glycosyltransferase [Phycisphaerae bacterium]
MEPALRLESPLPRALIVSWHWPPTNRASTGVLGNLFCNAPAELSRVITRCMPLPLEEDRTPVPPLKTHTVSWRLGEEHDGTLAEWFASIRAVLSMAGVARRLHQARPFERVLAVYPHRFSLLAGWWIARRRRVPLVVYMHDLFAEAFLTGSRLKRMFWRWVDRRVLADAALVVVPTDEFAAHYRRRGVKHILILPHCVPANHSCPPPLKGLSIKSSVAIPNVASPLVGDEKHGCAAHKGRRYRLNRQALKPWATPALVSRQISGDGALEPSSMLNLLYAGNLYDAHVDSIKAFLAAADQLDDVRVTLLTKPHPMLGGHPARWASRRETREALHTADVCVVALGHDTPYPQEIQGCFPSKIVDYLAVAKPILALVPPGCFVDRFIRETGTGIAVNTLDANAIREAIERLRDAELRGRLAHAAAHAAEQLQADIHLPRLLRGLTTLEPDEDETPAMWGRSKPCQGSVMEVPPAPGDTPQESVCATVL